MADEEQAASIVQHRREVRASPVDWTRKLGFEPAAHHRLILQEMEDLWDSVSYDTLLIFAPPGSAKSHHVSVAYPPYWLAKNPTGKILAASHSIDLAKRWGGRVRNIVAEHGPTLDIELSTDSTAADRWALATGAEYMAAGVQKGIAGFRADLGIIDDPFGLKEDAYSQRTREKVWDWYLNDFSARLTPHAKRVVMHTRWHEDDLAGRIMEQAKITGEPVRVVRLPAVAEPNDPLGRAVGEYLWDDPKGYDYGKFLRRRKTELAPLEWAAVYQQNPVSEEGNFFRKEWFKYYDVLPKGVRKYGASDYAVTADGGDFTEHGIAAIDADGNLYIDDWWRGQTAPDVWIDVMLDMAAGHEIFAWAEESGVIKKSVGPLIDRRMNERNIHFPRREFVSATDKPTRARTIQGRMAAGKVLFRRHSVWRMAFEAQILAFPAGKTDDAVDVLSLFGRMLDRMHPPRRTPPPVAKHRTSVRGAGWLG